MTSKTTTTAAVLVAPNQFEVQELELPQIGDDAALLKIEACGICGSDARIRRRVAAGPMIMGHENVGTIAAIGRAAAQRWRLQEGDRVALEEYVTCGACRWCRSELFRYCSLTDGGLGGPPLRYGSTPMSISPGLWGGYSEYLYVHPGAVIHRIPSDTPANLMTAFLPVANGVELACGYGGVGIGSSVLIQGPGEHGLAATMAARAAGATCIIVAGLGVDASRLEIARKVGAHHTVDVEREDLVTRVKDVTGGEGVDVVINITGAGTNTVEQGLAAAAKVATVVISDAGKESVSEASFGRRELTLKSSNGHSYRSCERAIDMIAAGEVDIAALSVPPYGLDQAATAIDAVAGLIDRSITFASIEPRLGPAPC
ncbi:MAG: alcohol dehydrogenase catalytic domain-containing protein [Chloroflexi bacterium]|nr:alcohol dehydrogenase catalytic domain-containing protein [Chloroflexota bacterium]MBV9132409.1 alcohol dehydrogenase catalytic domain-containing protein [Chloroflexota bacterium]MBV9899150.1 alcohol dehydrogenase catalytic domain-containing protein [Chloroflexota bacterium]